MEKVTIIDKTKCSKDLYIDKDTDKIVFRNDTWCIEKDNDIPENRKNGLDIMTRMIVYCHNVKDCSECVFNDVCDNFDDCISMSLGKTLDKKKKAFICKFGH